MGFDGLLVPDWAKPYVGWVVGMDWPEGDETGCFRLADACVTAAHRIVEGTAADQPWTADKIGSEWDGAAHLAFAERVNKMAGQQVADLVNRLINTAVALNGVGVQIQYAKYMIEVTVWLLIVQIAYLIAAAYASGGASLALIPPRVQLARLAVAQIAKRTLLNIALFAGIVAGMDAGIQLTQMAQGRRDEFDVRQLGVSALSGGAMGGLMGLLSGGLTRLATPALRAGLTRAEMATAERLLAAASSSVYGQAAQYAVTGGITTAGTMLAQGNFSWDLLAKGITSSALGADGQHLTPTLPTRGGDTSFPNGDPFPDPHNGPHPGPDPVSLLDTDPRLTSDPVTQSNTDPVTQSNTDPVTRNSADPVTQSNTDPVTRNSADPVTQSNANPVTRNSADPVIQSNADPVTRSNADPVPHQQVGARVEPGTDPDRGTTLSQATDTASAAGPTTGPEPARRDLASHDVPDRQAQGPAGEAQKQAAVQQHPMSVHPAEAAPRPRTPEQGTHPVVRGTPDHGADGAPRQPGERASGSAPNRTTQGGTPHQVPERPVGGTPHQVPERTGGGAPPHQTPERPVGGTPHQAPERTGSGLAQPTGERGPGSSPADTAGRGGGAEPGVPARQGASGETPPMSRIERLLNHHVPDSGDTGPSPQTPGGAGQATDGTPPPPRPGELSARPPQGGPGSGNSTSSRVPFDFQRFYNDPRWTAEATRFEQSLGAYYFNDSKTVDAARAALGKLRDVLLGLTSRQPGESREAFVRRVESVFFKDDAASAGQVGTRSGVTVDDLLAHGNLRELVTAFYNGAYYNRANPLIFGNALLDIMDNGGWGRAREVGLDIGEVRRAQHQLDERLHRPLLGRLEARFMPNMYTFNRDPFGTGNVGMLSERGARDVAEIIQSQFSRHERTEEHIQELGLNTTPRHYDRLGAPLGRFERAFVEENVHGRLAPDTPLPWREGVTMHDTTGSRWARKITAEGFPVIDGVSGTTAKMLTAVKFLNLGPSTTEHFLGALMGWMLPGRDHSLFEIARGAQIADVGGMRLEPGSRPNVVDFYRSLPGIDLATLRREILPDGMFPHESRYAANARDPAGFSETQHPKVGGTVDRFWPQFETGRVTDPDLAGWLDRSGIDPSDPAQVRALGERLSPAHVMALTVYTRHSHYLINNVTRTQLWTGGVSESMVQNRMVDKVHQLVGNYLDNLAANTKALPLPMALRPLLHMGDGHLDSRSPLSALADSYVDAARRTEEAKQRFAEARDEGRKDDARQAGKDLRQARRDGNESWKALKEHLGQVMPRLWDEMRWHADMVHDAMAQLPGVGSPERPVQAYRGDWMTPVHSPIYGSRLHPYGTAREFLSVSKLLEVAIRFMVENPAGERKILVAYQLTGQQAKDISIFSSFTEDQEAVFPPHSRVRRRNDPELVASLRDEVDRLAADMVERGVIPEVPRSYEIIVMEEG
ncbi:hypothetical protein AB0G15_28085 [Streptosporangium sp. NPDC023825]|uniref:WXG100-like domain-containing protein n=1 Tax=Streptosporangium sp. NPDC023825 TaxID=3154909 RepID=UPI00341B71EE